MVVVSGFERLEFGIGVQMQESGYYEIGKRVHGGKNT